MALIVGDYRERQHLQNGIHSTVYQIRRMTVIHTPISRRDSPLIRHNTVFQCYIQDHKKTDPLAFHFFGFQHDSPPVLVVVVLEQSKSAVSTSKWHRRQEVGSALLSTSDNRTTKVPRRCTRSRCVLPLLRRTQLGKGNRLRPAKMAASVHAIRQKTLQPQTPIVR